MFRLLWISISLICVCGIATAQTQITDGYFQSPVDHPIRIAGSFAELRSNHFHAGIDIKSRKGTIGDTIRAVANGHVSRIKIQRGGYGNVLYIDHPNGYTSVYAHLNSFNPAIKAYVENEQRKQHNSEVDVYIDSDTLNVAQGQSIGLMGNTGRSYGPHLHFEIRDTKSETPQNPYLHGIGPSDHKTPLLYSVAALGFDKELNEIHKEIKYINKKNGKYTPQYLFKVPTWRVGMTIQAFDLMDGASNKNGIYQLKMYVDDELHYAVQMDSIGWDESKYINSFIDYKDKKVNNRTMIRCYQQVGNPLRVYKTVVNNGFFKIFKDKARRVRFEVIDFFGNKSTYSCQVKRLDIETTKEQNVYTKKIKHNESYHFSLGCNELYFPKGVTDNTLFLQFSQEFDKGNYSMKLGDETEPVFNKIQIHISVKHIPEHLRDKTVLAYLDTSTPTSFGGILTDDTLFTSIDRLGKYTIAVDTIPPKITPLEINKTAINKGRLLFKLTDNFATRGSYAKDITYDVFIDGNWTICSLKALGGVLTIPVKDATTGKHSLTIITTDHSGNQTIWEGSFTK